jgi:DNA-3-methyladenine glycosylase I
MKTCTWPADDAQMIHYHDKEWGVPVHDDKTHFEYLVLDTFQAGLSWKTILHKRPNFKKAFASFDVKKVARFDEANIQALMQDAGIIRNQLKIRATVTNAQAFIAIQKEYGSFDAYIWQFVDGKPIQHQIATQHDLPATTVESDNMSKALKKRGFKFVGSTICYAYMQACGMVNDHLKTCFRYKQVGKEMR